jgi:hypothetical protein
MRGCIEKSNHRHLGQLLTYACGKGAATIIWIAPGFCEEHRAALNWLNSITEERFRFFAVTIEVLRIGKYQAPRFTVAAAPTGESMAVRNAGPKPIVSESGRTRFKYWQTFLSQLRLVDKTVELPKANSLGNLRFSLQGRDLWITVYAAASLGRIGVFLRGNETFHSVLRRNRQTIQRQLGKPLRWNEAEDGWSIGLARSAHLSDESDWPAQHEWLATRLQKFLRVFKPYAKRNA